MEFTFEKELKSQMRGIGIPMPQLCLYVLKICLQQVRARKKKWLPWRP